MSRNTNTDLEKGRNCKVCGLLFAYRRKTAAYCSPRCRKRWQRGHVTTATIRRTAKGFVNGQLSDYRSEDYSYYLEFSS